MSIRYPSDTLSPYSIRIRKVIKLANAIAIDYWNGNRDHGTSTWCPSGKGGISVDYHSYGDDHEMSICIDDKCLHNVWFESNNMRITTSITDPLRYPENHDDGWEEFDVDEWVELVESKITEIEDDNGETISKIYSDTAPFEEKEERMLNGSYRNMVYISSGMKADAMPDNDINTEYKKYYEMLERGVSDIVQSKKNAYLIITPLVCDKKESHGFEKPEASNNYIVVPFNKSSLDLIDKLVIPSGSANNTIATYVALEINDDAPDYNEHLSEGVDSEEHIQKMLALSLDIGNWLAGDDKLTITTYFELSNEGLIEQGFDFKNGEDEDGYFSVEGFVTKWNHDDSFPDETYDQYRVDDSHPISKYLLTKEELVKKADEFNKNPWAVGTAATEHPHIKSIDYPTQFESEFPVYILKTAKLALIIADDWRNSNAEVAMFEPKWVPENIKVSVNQHAENNKDIYTLVINANGCQVELWFKDDDAELDVEYLFEEFSTIDSKNAVLDLSEANLNKWIAEVENILLDDMSRKEIQKEVYSDLMLVMNGIEKDTNDIAKKVAKKKVAKKKAKKKVAKKDDKFLEGSSISPSTINTHNLNNKMFDYQEKSKNGDVTFSGIQYVCEVFKTPIPFEEYQVSSIPQLCRMSTAMNGTDELFLPSADVVDVDFNGEKEQISSNDFVDWQLLKLDGETIYYLINKCEPPFEEFFNDEEEYEKNNEYDPEDWLNEKIEDSKEEGLTFIERMRKEEPVKFVNILRGAILDEDIGLTKWLETEVFPSTFEEGFDKYSDWDVMLMVVSKGDFFPYICDASNNLSMDDGHPNRMFIRNYDEGDI